MEEKKMMTPEESSQWLIDSINAYRESTGRDQISAQLADQIRASNRRLSMDETEENRNE